jgi:hypothetical protein
MYSDCIFKINVAAKRILNKTGSASMMLADEESKKLIDDAL